MKPWQEFLDSLSTKGGNIVCAGVVIAGLVLAMHHSHSADMFATVRDLLVGFSGALLAMLKGDSSRQQMMDRRDSVAPASSVDVAKVETVNVVTSPEKP